MEKPSRPTPNSAKPAPPQRSGMMVMLIILMMIMALYLIWVVLLGSAPSAEVTYDVFWRELKKSPSNVIEVRFENPYEIHFKSRNPILDVIKNNNPFVAATEAGNRATEAAKNDPKTNPKSAESTLKSAANDAVTGATTKTSEGESSKTPATPPPATKPAAVAKPVSYKVILTPQNGQDLDEALRESGATIYGLPLNDSTSLFLTMYVLVPVLLFLGLWFLMSRMRDQMSGGGILGGFSRSPAKRYDTTTKPVTFADVAGLEGVKNDLTEVVEFLKNPQKFARLGGRIPKGILLFGPPGTGKTLLARAVAGEAGVPFFSISGSEFIQMFVGVGASRVRDMFRTAKEASPAILFIDEIDAVGRHRGAGLGGGNDEREQTLNQILSEMDGFSPNESVIVVAATNRPDVLDPALLRPGRFDRHITVDRPNIKARIAMFKVHCRDVPLATGVDLQRLAAGTVGLTGADIRNLVNEAALWATRNGKNVVDMDDFEYARDKVLMGPKREEVLTGKEKTMTAYHEAGHALLAWMLPGVDRVHKVTIVPRGRALGVTQLLPEEDRLNIGQSELFNRLIFIMGGRAAEKIIYDQYSAGAENDLSQATKIARRMVSHWGMSERLGPVAFRTSEEHPFLGKEIVEQREFSENTAQLIDEEISRILREADERARALLIEQRVKLDLLATELEKREILDDVEIAELIGPSANRLADSKSKAEAEATADVTPEDIVNQAI
jgi:cell division protease FtsH